MSLQNAILPAVARFAKDLPFLTDPSALATAVAATTLAAAATATTAATATPPTAPATAAAAASTTTTTPTAAMTGSPHDRPEGSGECRLLGSFAVLVQLALGGLALLSLVYKRWRERPQRPVKIWFFDVSKQVFGSVLVHMANVFMSMLTSGRFSIKLGPPAAAVAAAPTIRSLLVRADDGYVPNPCSFYLLNLAIDTTLGIPILILLLRITTGLVAYTPMGKPAESIQSGNYGSPPRAWWWFKQSIIYFCGLFGMKICVLIIFLVLPWISRVGDWALGWTEGNEKLQIIFVMMLFPLIMNAMQYYIIDSFIKKQTDTSATADATAATGDERAGLAPRSGDGPYDRLSSESVDEEELVEQEDSRRHRQGGAAKATATPQRREYDPDLDGDDERTVIGSSTSSNQQAQALISKDLLPHE